jgi:magnesium and cobalt transporter
MTKNETEGKSWLERLSQLLIREPKTRDELLALLREGGKRHLVDPDTASMIEGVIRFSELRVRDIMIPRVQMVVISSTTSLDSLFALIEKHTHSRYPVIGESKDEILGILHAKDLLPYKLSDKNFSLNEILRPHTVVPESKHLNILLSEFRINRNHMAIVVDEYGGVSGFVTIEDLLEQIVGDIEDEFDNDDEAYVKIHKNGAFVVKAHMPIDEFNEYFKRDFNDETYDTLGGMIIKACDHMPSLGETVKIDNVCFKILNADGRRIKLVEFTNEVG